MSSRTIDAIRIIRLVTERPDPVSAIPLGAIARATATSPSSASRLCAELAHSGMLTRGDGYGTYSLGPRAIHLSGNASRPHAHAQRVALTLAAQQTGETVLLAAPDGAGRLRIVDHITSSWTLHAPARLGEAIEDADSAGAGRLSHGRPRDTPPHHPRRTHRTPSASRPRRRTPHPRERHPRERDAGARASRRARCPRDGAHTHDHRGDRQPPRGSRRASRHHRRPRSSHGTAP
jgi:DNA-binding IclR family transcriptional regulator